MVRAEGNAMFIIKAGFWCAAQWSKQVTSLLLRMERGGSVVRAGDIVIIIKTGLGGAAQ